jgi:uncharacterized protein YciI
MAWFIKTETFRLPRPQLQAHLQAHHAWVAELRQQGVVISSGYLVDQAGRPGGGGLLLLAAEDYAAAEALVRQDPLIANGCVDWQLQGWIPAVGDLAVGDLALGDQASAALVAGEGGCGETVTFGDGNRHHGIGAGG